MLSTYPFTSHPTLRSHLHPKFAILEAGRKLTSMKSYHLKNLLCSPQLQQVVGIYHAWTRNDLPLDWKDDVGFNPPLLSTNTGNTDSDDETVADRYGDRYGRHARRLEQQHSPGATESRADRKRKRETLSSQSIAQHRALLGRREWSSDQILSWSNEASSGPL
jgi:hypothetical protein